MAHYEKSIQIASRYCCMHGRHLLHTGQPHQNSNITKNGPHYMLVVCHSSKGLANHHTMSQIQYHDFQQSQKIKCKILLVDTIVGRI